MNEFGTYRCEPKFGFERIPYGSVDIDECSTGMNDCNWNADCINIPGSYECQCHAGYTGFGSELKLFSIHKLRLSEFKF